MRTLLAAALLAAAVSTPALADETTGTLVAFDRKANVIVMEDKTIWELSAETVLPDDLAAGEIVTIVFTSTGDDGVKSVDEIVRN